MEPSWAAAAAHGSADGSTPAPVDLVAKEAAASNLPIAEQQRGARSKETMWQWQVFERREPFCSILLINVVLSKIRPYLPLLLCSNCVSKSNPNAQKKKKDNNRCANDKTTKVNYPALFLSAFHDCTTIQTM